ncbi:MAG: cadmium-translocating P-type ATPase [Erysipelotrichaceae bacterium]|nr:cadmium-translocating P-type ATPase [Erysipelotrichaceae bacterium]
MACNCHNCEHEDVHEHEHHHDEKKERIILIIRLIISFLLLILGACAFTNEIISKVLIVISYIIISYDVIFKSFKNIIKHKDIFDENFLMMIASVCAIIVSFLNKDAMFDANDGVLVILLYQIGEFLQDLAVDKSKDSISNMMDINVEKTTILSDGIEKVISTDDVKIDDVFIVKPGDVIITDGIIIKGSSSLNTSSLTGESKPLEVYENDKVLSGFINNDGILYVKATTTFSNSTTAKVKKIIDEAAKKKASSEKFITSFSKIYTPIVILISLCVMFIIPLFLGFKENFYSYLYKGLTIMIISCPCALVISIPLSFFMGIGKSAKNSILVKGASYLEMLAKIDGIAFDKTGTITNGTFIVSEINSTNEPLMKSLLYSCEKHLTHPIAKSIVSSFNNEKELDIIDLENKAGYGLSAYYLQEKILIGNEKLMRENNINIAKVDSHKTIIYVAYKNEYLGYIIIEDTIKDDAVNCIKQLKKDYQVSLISGDNKEIVKEVASKLDIDDYYYEALPDQKLKILKNIAKDKKIAYVGDGINDAPCLIESDVGIAMKSLGSDIAISSSDIVIMDDKLNTINKAIKISKKTMRNVVENVIISLATKIIIMLLAIFINIPMYVAIIGDVGVCLLAILNSLRIMYGKIK